MTCRHCLDAADLFSSRMAKRELARFRRRGPSRSTRLLLDALAAEGAMEPGPGTRLLDIGGGVGAIQHAFADAGAGAVASVDASPAYLVAVQSEAARRGTLSAFTFTEGDAVELEEELPEARVVTLDRVLCCYPDMPALVRASASRATGWWGVVFPREWWGVRLGVAIINLVQRIRGQTFRVYLHGPDRMTREAALHGLRPVSSGRTLLWEVRLFRR